MTTHASNLSERRERTASDELRRPLLGVLLFVGLNALGGGIYGLSGARAVPSSWLSGSPFTSYFIPSLILIFAVGGSSLLSAAALHWRWRIADALSAAAGAVLALWIGAQLAIIGYVSWLQPAMALLAALVLLVALIRWRRAHSER